MEPVKFKGMTTNYVADGCGDLPAMVEEELKFVRNGIQIFLLLKNGPTITDMSWD